jgi:2-polyprenyl-6-methoxyphenol hydroxylase-like FAD-dependent oxidoreductase
MMDQRTGPVDVLVVGAGPTGLALAIFGATVRVVDQRAVPGRESRALVVQPHPGASAAARVTPALVEAGPGRVGDH